MNAGPSNDLETAVLLAVDLPELQTVYRDSYPAFAELGVPLHVTLLYTFVPPGELDAALPRLRAVLARHERFTFELTELRTFSRTVWVAPEPAAPFVALTKAIEAAFPGYHHWEGRLADVIPHLTLADGIEPDELTPTLARLRTLVEPLLPVRSPPRRRPCSPGDRAAAGPRRPGSRSVARTRGRSAARRRRRPSRSRPDRCRSSPA